jgi:hypothetical protein
MLIWILVQVFSVYAIADPNISVHEKLNGKPFISINVRLPQNLFYQIDANIGSVRIRNHHSGSAFPHQRMRAFSSEWTVESKGV